MAYLESTIQFNSGIYEPSMYYEQSRIYDNFEESYNVRTNPYFITNIDIDKQAIKDWEKAAEILHLKILVGEAYDTCGSPLGMKYVSINLDSSDRNTAQFMSANRDWKFVVWKIHDIITGFEDKLAKIASDAQSDKKLKPWLEI